MTAIMNVPAVVSAAVLASLVSSRLHRHLLLKLCLLQILEVCKLGWLLRVLHRHLDSFTTIRSLRAAELISAVLMMRLATFLGAPVMTVPLRGMMMVLSRL